MLTSVSRAGVNVSFSISWDGEGEGKGLRSHGFRCRKTPLWPSGTLGGAIEEISRSVVAGKQAEWQ